ncbi:MAG: hypothetical protein HPY64_04005 [Anaerolineae bacterium]|nr:hypothetical protein [Anaerolineae bacterium]
MRDVLRTGVTAVIWVVFTMFMIAQFAMASETPVPLYYFVAMATTGALAILAFMLTVRVWRREEPETRRLATTKAKRGNLAVRLERLAEELDEDDLIELETLIRMRGQEHSG